MFHIGNLFQLSTRFNAGTHGLVAFGSRILVVIRFIRTTISQKTTGNRCSQWNDDILQCRPHYRPPNNLCIAPESTHNINVSKMGAFYGKMTDMFLVDLHDE